MVCSGNIAEDPTESQGRSAEAFSLWKSLGEQWYWAPSLGKPLGLGFFAV